MPVNVDEVQTEVVVEGGNKKGSKKERRRDAAIEDLRPLIRELIAEELELRRRFEVDAE